jgi:hypothetical protein
MLMERGVLQIPRILGLRRLQVGAIGPGLQGSCMITLHYCTTALVQNKIPNHRRCGTLDLRLVE